MRGPTLFLRVAPLVIASFAMGCGPVWMLPGGSLSGSTRPAPDDWAFSDTVDIVQLETLPSDPYSVNIWGVGVGDRFYVAAGEVASSQWARNIAQDPDVRLKVGDAIYDLRAVRVQDDAEIEACMVALKRKYDFEPEPEQSAGAAVFRLESRGPS